MNAGCNNSNAPRWLTWWAWLTVAAVLPLLFLGALVTTLKVGMADQRSVVSPLEAIVEVIRGDKDFGWKVEHTHRLAGWFAGICGIGLAIGFWFGESGSRFRWLGLVGLTLISLQGLLGIFRVQLNCLWGPDLAWIHGVFAQIVFAVLAGLALMVSPGWRSRSGDGDYSALRRWSVICIGLVFGQLIMGGMIRHQPSLLMARGHIFGAFLVLAGLLWLAKLSFDAGFRWTGWILLGLVGLEIALGVETGVHWMARFFRPDLDRFETVPQLLTRTTHYVVGSLVFAATTMVALQAYRGRFVFAEKTRPVAEDAVAPLLAGQSLQGGIA